MRQCLFRNILILICVLISTDVVANQDFPKSTLIIKSPETYWTLDIEVANTPALQSLGLQHRKSLADNYGMLFIFEPSRTIQMWMKNTYVSLDMLFIDDSGVVRKIVKATKPLSLDIISSGGKARAVLELKAGTTARLKIGIGNQIVHDAFK